VTSVGSGAGLTGGPITGSGTLSIATGGVTNAMLANPSVTVTAGSGLTGGGTATLGSAVTLKVDSTKVPLLGASSNTFTGSITASSFTGSGAGLTNVTAATASNALNLGGQPPSAYQPAGSYATTGANTFTANQSVGGNVTATGALSASSVTSTGSGTPTVQLGNAGPTWTSGLGAPTSSCTVGSLYSRTDGVSGSTLYVCVGPSGTWKASQT